MRRLQPTLSFEANRGQADREVRFLLRGLGYNLFLTSHDTVLTLAAPASGDGKRQRDDAVRVRLLGAAKDPVVEALDESPTRSNYFIGRDPARWRTNVPHYERVRLLGVYPGIDQVFHSAAAAQFEYDFVVGPGAEPSRIRVGFDGVDALRVNDANSLVLTIGADEIEQRAPNVYQDIDGSRHTVAARYVITGPREVGFEIAPYDRTRPLVIDPVVVYATYTGGNGQAVATDSSGNVYMTGATFTSNFPTVNPLQPSLTGNFVDSFVLKIDPTGTRLLYATYLGGSVWDAGAGIAVDPAGNIYVAGTTNSADFPTRNALQPALGGNGSAFVAKLNPSGSALIYSTYLGGSSATVYAMAVDKDGRVYITGETYSSNFTVVNALQPAKRGTAGSTDAFVLKLDASGAALVYSTYLGGTAQDSGRGIAVDAAGNAYVTGQVTSGDATGGGFPMLNARQPTFGGGFSDAFVVKISAGGTLLYSTFLGGSGSDGANAIAVAADGRTYVTGSTQSVDFPAVNAYKTTNGDASVYKSTDGGRNWRRLGLDNVRVNNVAIDRLNPATVYVGTSGQGIFKSTDGGTQWTAITTGLPSLSVGAVLPDPFIAGTVYATGNNLMKSTDGGRHWAVLGVDSSPQHTIRTLTFDPVRPNIMYAGSYSGLASTQDGGASWAYSGLSKIAAIAVDPMNPSIIYAGRVGDGSDDDRGGMFKSTDGGGTWAAMPRGPIPPSPHNYPPNVSTFVVDPRATSTVYLVAVWSGLYKSTTGGNEWTAVTTGLPTSLVSPSLVMDPLNSSVLYLGTLGGIFKTVDAGATWTSSNNGLFNLSIASLAVSPTEPGVIYAAASGGTQDAFLASLTADGSSLQSSTFLGGGAEDVGTGVAIDGRGNVYVTGWTTSNSFPTVDPFQPAAGGAEDAFVAAFNGAALLYASSIGGTGSDRGAAIAVDATGNVFVTGSTGSTNFPLTRPLQTAGGAFVVKLGPVAARAQEISRMTAGGPAGAPASPPTPTVDSDVFTTHDGVRYQVETVANGLDLPSAMAFAPDGRLFVAERAGRVRIFDAALRSSSIALTVADVFVQGDAGLLGLALDPDFARTRWAYLYYTARAGAAAVNRVVRYRELDGRLTERVVLLDDVPGNSIHNGGDLRFGPDDLLYVATGDAGAPPLAQDLASFAGKILRLNRDGTTPRGNPFASPVFSSGHRDPQGLDWQPATGDLWSEDQGSAGSDEINVIAAGGNYGWPRIEGRQALPGMQPPVAVFDSATVPTGGSFYRGARVRSFDNDFFIPTLESGLLRIRLTDSPARIAGSERLVDTRFGRLRSVIVGPNGLLYFVTSNGARGGEADDRLLRIVPQ